MRKNAILILYTLLLAAIVCACSNDLDIKRNYDYHIEILPLPNSLKTGESVALEFSIVREGNYTGTTYKFRYFQSDGKGILSNSKGDAIPMNRFQEIENDDFVLTYQCQSEELQQLDFVFENNFGQRVEYSVKFSGERTTEKEENGR
ncbi:MAG: DUF3872 domain-containing protein [Prevotellaceae bacterium]|jgi:hypothetical protein|nr:DUF3872 domain-containing protein [Prevotellaceae bacterium]